jgi:hypothetical protein
MSVRNIVSTRRLDSVRGETCSDYRQLDAPYRSWSPAVAFEERAWVTLETPGGFDVPTRAWLSHLEGGHRLEVMGHRVRYFFFAEALPRIHVVVPLPLSPSPPSTLAESEVQGGVKKVKTA